MRPRRSQADERQGEDSQVSDPKFRADLYRGAARAYDAYRLPYPRDLIDDLAARSGADGTGRLLDLACGTGQVAFALQDRFAEIWAVDQEPDMIEVVASKAAAAGQERRLAVRTCAIEELSAPALAFDLVTIGNAFHRLRREQTAARVLHWLRSGGHLALLWGGSPALGDAPWQQALRALMLSWQDRNAAGQRIPPGYEAARLATPDLVILRAAGFEITGRYEFAFTHDWTFDEIAGFVASTSILSAAALGAAAQQFDADLRRELGGGQPDGRFRQDSTFAFELALRP
jgi:SAM-dependent methyltransferase